MSYDEYIKKIETEIDRIKNNNLNRTKKVNLWADFSVQFVWDRDLFSKYFLRKGMTVQFSPCGCGDNKYDIIIRWTQ